MPNHTNFTDQQVRNFFNNRCTESKELVVLEKVNGIIGKELRTNMRKTNVAALMQDLFANYRTILERRGLKWIIKDN